MLPGRLEADRRCEAACMRGFAVGACASMGLPGCRGRRDQAAPFYKVKERPGGDDVDVGVHVLAQQDACHAPILAEHDRGAVCAVHPFGQPFDDGALAAVPHGEAGVGHGRRRV